MTESRQSGARVRRLTKDDIPAIVRLRIELQLTDHRGDLGVPREVLEERTHAFLEEHLDRDLFLFGAFLPDGPAEPAVAGNGADEAGSGSCADRRAEPVSICGLTLFAYFPQADDLTGRVGYISSVYTVPEHRRRGLQRAVFEACLRLGESLGLVRYELATQNPDAVRLYQSYGFRPDPEAMIRFEGKK